MTDNQQPTTHEDTAIKTEAEEPGPKIRLRAIILGSVFALAICLITPFNNASGRREFSVSALLYPGVVDDFNGLCAHAFSGPQNNQRKRTAGVLGNNGASLRNSLDRIGTDLLY